MVFTGGDGRDPRNPDSRTLCCNSATFLLKCLYTLPFDSTRTWSADSCSSFLRSMWTVAAQKGNERMTIRRPKPPPPKQKTSGFVGCLGVIALFLAVVALAPLFLPKEQEPPTVDRSATTRSQPSNTTGNLAAQFNAGLSGNMSCAQLFRIRNAPKQGQTDAEQQRMNERLRSVGCFSSTSERATSAPAPTAAGLTRASKSGLLGAPVPSGATLKETKKGDPANGIDSQERYQIKASAAEIEAFYRSEMSRDGWRNIPMSVGGILSFRKGTLMLGVLFDAKGGSFTLMGS